MHIRNTIPFFTTTIIGLLASSASASPPIDKAGTCSFYKGNTLELSQRCAISYSSGAGMRAEKLSWEDGVSTEIVKILAKNSNDFVATVDGEDAEEYNRKGNTCYRIGKNRKSVCFKADVREPVRIIRGCGTGCSVSAIMITDVRRNSHRLNGKTLNTVVLFSRTTGGGRGRENFESIIYLYGSCATKEVGFGKKYGQGPNPEWWKKLDGTHDDYITVYGNRGDYFDAVCKR